MTDKERLVDVLNKAYGGCARWFIAKLADAVIADGWIRPPCKVGQILYVIGSGIIHESKVKEYKYCSNSNNDVHWHIVFEDRFTISEAHIGKIAFYTREEAEKALKGGKGFERRCGVMGKLIKLPPPEYRMAGQTCKSIFVDYAISENCCNEDSYRQVCIKCGKCGRKFINGFLREEGAE